MEPIIEMIHEAKNAGYIVLVPKKITSYFYITDGQDIGYCQYNNLQGKTFSTVHKANKYTGTGYEAFSMSEALRYKPAWASNDGNTISKYTGPIEFIKNHWQELNEYNGEVQQ